MKMLPIGYSQEIQYRDAHVHLLISLYCPALLLFEGKPLEEGTS